MITTIARLIISGAPRVKIIAKYGKKLFDKASKAVKEDLKTDKKLYAPFESWKLVLGGGTAVGGAETIRQKEKNNPDSLSNKTLRSSKDKKFSGHTGYRK